MARSVLSTKINVYRKVFVLAKIKSSIAKLSSLGTIGILALTVDGVISLKLPLPPVMWGTIA